MFADNAKGACSNEFASLLADYIAAISRCAWSLTYRRHWARAARGKRHPPAGGAINDSRAGCLRRSRRSPRERMMVVTHQRQSDAGPAWKTLSDRRTIFSDQSRGRQPPDKKPSTRRPSARTLFGLSTTDQVPAGRLTRDDERIKALGSEAKKSHPRWTAR